jgi:DNA-binding response OmpR family regulator
MTTIREVVSFAWAAAILHEQWAPNAIAPVKALRVLVVEDDPMVGMLLAEMLEAMGHNVCALETTEAGAVAAAAQHRPDLMIVDARLGAGSGVAAVEEILRAQFIPHVFMSGDITKVGALRPGATAIEKPFHEAELARAIQRVLDLAAPS